MLAHFITKGQSWTKDLPLTLAQATLGALALALFSQIKIHLPGNPVPLTLQVLVVILLGGLLGARLALAAVAEYLALGLLGLGVFAGGASGLATLTGATGGYLIGFLAAAALCGAIYACFGKMTYGYRLLGAVLAGLLGVAVIYTTGWLWLAADLHLSLHHAFLAGVAPFIVGDIQKVCLAAALLALHGKGKA